MKKYILICVQLFSISVNAQITRVEHIFAGSPKAEEVFNFFRKELGLPAIWNFQNWGDFASGGVTLGNVVLEIGTHDGAARTTFERIALEPRQPAEEFILQLDRAKVLHDTLERHTDNDTVPVWSTITLRGLLPEQVGLSVYDFKSREDVSSTRKRASDLLGTRKGGPLGVVLLKEIVVGAKNISTYTKALAKLPGIKKQGDALFGFQEGPSLRLQGSKTEGIEKIVVKVRSLAEAETYLTSLNLLGKSSAKSIIIDPQALDGLVVELVEK